MARRPLVSPGFGMRTFILVSLVTAAALGGCLGSGQPESTALETPPAGTAGAALGPLTDRIAGHILVSAATPERTFNFGGTFVNAFEVTETVTGYVLEVEWSPSSDLSSELSLWVRQAGVGAIDPTNPNLVSGFPNVARVDGPSPLRMALPAADFPEPGAYEWVVRASGEPVGAAIEQTFLMRFTAFDGVAFDEAFTDIPPEPEEP